MSQQHTPTLQDMIKNAIEARLAGVHTAMPGVVVSYDPKTQTADVQPAIRKKYADGTVVNLPLLTSIPVIFQRTEKGYLHFPIAKDDTVLIIFCERSIDAWRLKGGVIDPKDFRKHDLSDAVCIPGLFARGSEFEGEDGFADLVQDDMRIRIGEGFIGLGKDGAEQTEPVPLGLVLKTYLEDIHEQLADILDILIAGDHVLTTSPGSPTAPNPAKAVLLNQAKTALDALKSSPIADKKFLSDVVLTEKGN
jgi:hypothetical protein